MAKEHTGRFHTAKGFAKEVWQGFNEDRAPLAAAGIAFYIMLSMIPLLLLFVSVATFFITQRHIQQIEIRLSESLGAGIGAAVRDQVIAVLHNRGILTGISLLIGLWAGSQIFTITSSALDQMWNVQDKRPFWVRRGIAIIMVIVTGVLLAIAIGLNYLVIALGRLNIPLLGYHINEIPWFIAVLANFVLPLLLVVVAFTLIYRYLSVCIAPWGTVLVGASVAGVLWVLVLIVFSWYTANLANYSLLYGSLGSLVLLMLWFNYSAQLLLLGAEISAVLHQHKC